MDGIRVLGIWCKIPQLKERDKPSTCQSGASYSSIFTWQSGIIECYLRDQEYTQYVTERP